MVVGGIEFEISVSLVPKLNYFSLGVTSKKNSIFADIVQIGGGEVSPMSKNFKEMIFWQKLGREGVTKHIVKSWSTLFCMIYHSVYTPVP